MSQLSRLYVNSVERKRDAEIKQFTAFRAPSPKVRSVYVYFIRLFVYCFLSLFMSFLVFSLCPFSSPTSNSLPPSLSLPPDEKKNQYVYVSPHNGIFG